MKDGKLLVASVAAAVAASLCCILPIAFAILGVSVVGASAALAAWRPYLLAATGILLAAGFYFAYRPAAACAPGEACAVPAAKHRGRIALWCATALVVAFAAFPSYSGPVATWLLPGPGPAATAPAGRIEQTSLAIQGMDCSACAVAITHNLQRTPGVVHAQVSYPAGRAVVSYRAGEVTTAQLIKAVAAAGYRSHPM
jgi:mercuric ion transport protein